MRVRPVLVIGGIFGAAALTTVFVVSQFPLEGQVSAPAEGAAPIAVAPTTTPPLEPAAGPADGVLEVRVTAGGEPQADVSVRAYADVPALGWRRAAEARTAADGTARLFAGPGTYLLAARGAGLAPARAEAVRHAGEDTTRVDVVLEPAAALEGRVTARGGGPVAGARVRVVPVVSRFPGFAPPSTPAEETAIAETGPAGAFRIGGIAPGTYAVAFDATGYHPVLRRVLVPGEALAVAMEPLGRIEGVVLLDGAPAAGATVRAASPDHGAAATSGADGRFVLSAPAGSYRVHAALGERAAAAGPVAVAAGATSAPVELRLGPAATLEGEVVLAALAPRSEGVPAAGAEIAVFLHETGELAARARADAAGRFRVPGLAPDAFDVRATAPGASPALVSGVTLARGGRFPLRLALAGTGSAEGTVKDLAGRALAGVRVQVVQRGDGLAGAAPLEARSGFDGAWRIGGIEVGRAEIVARQEGVAVGVSRAVRVAEGRASRADLFLPEAGVLAGRVRADGKAPPPGTAVVAVPMRAGLGTLQVARAPADATGNYRLALPAGEYRVHAATGDADRTDLRVAPAFVHVDAGATARVDSRPRELPRRGGRRDPRPRARRRAVAGRGRHPLPPRRRRGRLRDVRGPGRPGRARRPDGRRRPAGRDPRPQRRPLRRADRGPAGVRHGAGDPLAGRRRAGARRRGRARAGRVHARGRLAALARGVAHRRRAPVRRRSLRARGPSRRAAPARRSRRRRAARTGGALRRPRRGAHGRDRARALSSGPGLRAHPDAL